MVRLTAIVLGVLVATLLPPVPGFALAAEGVPVAPSVQPRSPEDAARAERLRAEIAELERERAQISQVGPAVMSVVGYLSVGALVAGVLLLTFPKDICRSCDNAGAISLVSGGVGAAVGIGGMAWMIRNSERRQE